MRTRAPRRVGQVRRVRMRRRGGRLRTCARIPRLRVRRVHAGLRQRRSLDPHARCGRGRHRLGRRRRRCGARTAGPRPLARRPRGRCRRGGSGIRRAVPSDPIQDQLIGVALQLVDRDLEPEIVQQQELQLELVQFVERQTSDLGVSGIGVEDVREELARHRHTGDDEAMNVEAVNRKQFVRICALPLRVGLLLRRGLIFREAESLRL